MHERPFTRAAGVSPPWIFKPRLQVPYAGFPRCELGESTGGLRPPLLYCRANVRRQKSDFCDAHTNVHKSGGCQPAVVRESHRQGRACLADRGCSHATGGLRPPLLAGVQRLSAGRMMILRCTNARSQERRVLARRGCYDDGLQRTSSNGRRIATVEQRAAGVSPPWFGNRTGNGERVLPTVDAHMPRGAYAPRSCIAVRMSVDKKAIFAMHIRTFTRAAGVARRGFSNHVCKCHTLDFRVANSVSPRGAYAPRSCVAVRMSVDKKRFLRCTYERSQERRALSRRGCYDDGLQCTSSNGRRIATVEQRAAGVIPPWVLR
jgi:hypothetical protein